MDVCIYLHVTVLCAGTHGSHLFLDVHIACVLGCEEKGKEKRGVSQCGGPVQGD